MLFNSLGYVVFLGAVGLLCFATASRHRWSVLLAASYAFYMAWRPEYGLLLAGCTLLQYVAGRRIELAQDSRARRAWLLLGLVGGIGALVVFKYLAPLAHALRLSDASGLVVPVGISFYTFQSLGYTIDVFWKRRPAERHLGLFALYVSFFPLLLAGPIERSTHLLPQFREPKPFSYERGAQALRTILWGLFLKMAVADNIARFVDAVYHDVGAYQGLPLLTATAFFAIQLYADFSGYSLVAIGSAELLGYDVNPNFNAPYLATDLATFWRRWHISLYSWFSDYVFGPLSIALRERPTLAVPLAVLITFTLSGLWHGAAWTFVIWGALHGVALASLALTRAPRRRLLKKLPQQVQRGLGWLVTLGFVCFTYVFFRSDSLADALYVCAHAWRIDSSHLLGVPVVSRVSFGLYLALSALVLTTDVLRGDDPAARRVRGTGNVLVAAGLLLGIYVLGVFEQQTFIYFQF